MIFKVEIMGQRYTVQGPSEKEFAEEVAGLVDSRMREIDKKNENVVPLDIAVLTALNIASDYLQLREENSRLLEEVESRVSNMIEKLDELS